jgi:hypothetical protein
MMWWIHSLRGVNHQVVIQCNHKNIKYFQMSQLLSQWQPRWAEIFCIYHLVIKHLKGTKEPAEGPSRWPDYMIGCQQMKTKLLSTLAATSITGSYGDLLLEINRALETNCIATTIRPTLFNISIPDAS